MKHKKIILSLIIFTIVFCVLGIPFTGWWFNGTDDFQGLFLGYRTKNIKDLFYFFLHGDVGQGAGASNSIRNFARSGHFLGTYYRPLYCIYITLQHWIFGTNGYYFFLTNVFFHAINTVILFNIFL